MKPRLPFRFRVLHKIILPFLLIILLGIATTLPYGISTVSRLNQTKADHELAALSGAAVNYIILKLDEALAYAQIAVQDRSVRWSLFSGDDKDLRKYLIPLQSRLDIDFVAAYDPSGRVLVELGDQDVLSFIHASGIRSKVFLGMNIKSLELTPDRMLLAAGVVSESTGGASGALVLGFALDGQFLKNLAKMLNRHIALISPDRRLVVADIDSLAESVRQRLASGTASLPASLDITLDNEPYRAYRDDIRMYNIPQATIVLTTPMREIVALRNRLIAYMLLAALAGNLAVILMGGLMARAINNPLHRLIQLTEEVKRGNLDSRVEVIPNDELGDLTVSLNGMVASLKDNLSEIQASQDKVARYTHGLEQFSLQLQRDKHEMETILHNIREGLLMIDRGGIVLAANPEASKILECSLEDCQGQDLRKVLTHIAEIASPRDSVASVLDLSRAEIREEASMELILFKQQRTVYRVNIYPVFGERHDLLGKLLLFINITQEKDVEEMKNNFLATISHELRTPLTSIKGALNLLLDGNIGMLTSDQREFLKIASNNAERLTGLVNNILDLARIESGEFRTRKVRTDLVQLMEKALVDLKGVAVSRGMTVDFSSAVTNAPIMADPERVIQLVNNLVDNAIKFSEDRGTISVHLSAIAVEDRKGVAPHLSGLSSGSYFLVEVADRGRGIPPDQTQRIFDKFYQADMSSTRMVGGSGLGLTIARTITKEHGGAIWAENRPGGGSQFSFVLPRVPASSEILIGPHDS